MNPPLVVADPVVRGCGERTPGGVYVEAGLGVEGRPIEDFLIDPPLPVPAGLDLVNKPTLWQDERSGITHLLIWVGAEYYPWPADFIEEAKAHGVSRKLTPFLDFTQLSDQSQMILAHPRARNTLWQDQALPHTCHKQLPGHAAASGGQMAAQGPCLFKTYELIPRAAAVDPTAPIDLDGRQYFVRMIGSTAYYFNPSGESVVGLDEGVFASVPITGFALIKRADGSVQEQAEAALRRGHLRYYHADR